METKTSDRLHAAIQSGAWSTAQDLLASFRLEVEASWHAAASEQERRALSHNVTGFLQWARAMTLTSREGYPSSAALGPAPSAASNQPTSRRPRTRRMPIDHPV